MPLLLVLLLFETANVPQLRLSSSGVRTTNPVNLLPIPYMPLQPLFSDIVVDCNILFPLFLKYSQSIVSTSTLVKVGLSPALLPSVPSVPSVPAAPWSPFAPVLPVIPIGPVSPGSPLAPLWPLIPFSPEERELINE